MVRVGTPEINLKQINNIHMKEIFELVKIGSQDVQGNNRLNVFGKSDVKESSIAFVDTLKNHIDNCTTVVKVESDSIGRKP